MITRPRRRTRRPTRRQLPVSEPRSEAVAAAPPDGLHSARHDQLRRLRGSRTFVAGAVIVGFWVLCAGFGSLIASKDPLATDPRNALQAPSSEHWFGTDSLGRDSFARVMVGGRAMLVMAPSAALLATVLGTTLGLVAGYVRGAVDDVLSRIFEMFLTLPVVIFASLVLVAVGSSRLSIVVAVALPISPIVARSVRAAVLTERELEYVDAARARTEKAAYIMFREILPNVRAVVLVEFIVRLAYAVFAIATLSFIGVGVQPPTPDWGRQIFEHYSLLGGGLLGGWAVLFPTIVTSKPPSVHSPRARR
jgi:peptide/nickel transport system permease protein